MTQHSDRSARNSSVRSWHKSLPVQGICWLSSLSLLSSGLVVAQNEAAIDTIGDTNNTTQETAAPNRESASSPDFSDRRTRLRQRLRRSEASKQLSDAGQPKQRVAQKSRRTSIRRYRHNVDNSVDSPRVARRSNSNVEVSEASSRRIQRLRARLEARRRFATAQQQRPRVVISQRRVNRPKPEKQTVATNKDYNNAYIDPTDYNNTATADNYVAPSRVIITSRRQRSHAVAQHRRQRTPTASTRRRQQIASASGETAIARRRSVETKPTRTQPPSWLRRSQNFTVARVTPHKSRIIPPRESVIHERSQAVRRQPQVLARSQREVERKLIATAPPRTVARTITPPVVSSLVSAPKVRQLTASAVRLPINRNNDNSDRNEWRPQRVTSNVTKSNFERERIFNPSQIAPPPVAANPSVPGLPTDGISLTAPVTQENNAPKTSTVAYSSIPLTSVLPQLPTASTFTSTGLQFPLSIPAPVSSLFGWRQHPITGDRRFHTGADLSAPLGTPVLAAFTGQIEIADWVGGYGLTVVMNHNSAQQTLYAHLSQIYVQPGQWVERGTVIGRVGNTGDSTAPHLHFEVRNLTPEGWVAIDPSLELESAGAEFNQAYQPQPSQPGS